ncbi:hypothetical protein Tco_0889086 [Tanacetum coccineum]
MTHPSGSDTGAEKPLSDEKITPTITSKGTGDKPGVPDVTEDNSIESEYESWGNDEDDSNNKQEAKQDEESDDDNQEDEEVDQENESEDDEIESDEDKGMDDTTNQFDDDAPTLLTIPISVITKSSHVFTNIPQSSQTFTPPPILTTPTPPPTIETTNPLSTLPDFASVFRFNDRITALEKEVAKIKKDPLHTQVTSLVDEHLDIRLGETREEFMNFLSESLTARIKEQIKDQLPQILPKEVSNFAPPVIEKLIKESRDEVTLAKVSSQPQSTYEAPSTLTEFELKNILLDKMEKKPTTEPKKKDSTYGSSKGTKSQPKSSGKSFQSEKPVFEKPTPPQEPTDPDWNIGKTTQEGPTQNWLMTLADSTSTDKSLKDFDELMRTPIDFSGYILNGLKIENLTQEILLGPAFRLLKGGDYPFDLSKPLTLITRGNCQRVPFEFFINNDLKYLQGGVSTMTYMTFTTKSKAAKYDLPGIEDMVPNIWSPVKVAYDRYVLWVTHVKVMRKHRYGYLEEIVVRRADNVLYRFKEGDFPRLRINDIEDMLILVVQNRLTNLFGDDVADFAIALRMFTRSLVIQKRVEDLQLGVESYQKKINVTNPNTTRPDLKKRHMYTPYKDP